MSLDPIEAARLVAEAREIDHLLGEPATSMEARSEIFRTRDNLRAMADQLEAASAEVERVKSQAARDRSLIGDLENYADLKPSRETLIAERDSLRSEMDRLTNVVRSAGRSALRDQRDRALAERDALRAELAKAKDEHTGDGNPSLRPLGYLPANLQVMANLYFRDRLALYWKMTRRKRIRMQARARIRRRGY